MASLRDTVKDYQDELRDGIAWVAFWNCLLYTSDAADE